MWLALQAGLWGLVAGIALVIGAAIAFVPHLPQRAIAGVTAFGAGVLISVLAFGLIDEAYARGGFVATALGFLAGAVLFTAANLLIMRRMAPGRSRSGDQQMKAEEGGGLAYAVAALLDGVPESIVIGIGLLMGRGVSLVVVCAFFLSNLPEGMSSAVGMRKAGRSTRYILGVWIGIALALGVAAAIGNVALAGAPEEVAATALAVAAGAILAVLIDTMIPEAYAEAHEYAGLITALGFLTAFALAKLGE